MTPADLAALAAAGLTRFAEGRLDDLAALSTLVFEVGTLVDDATPNNSKWPQTTDDAVARLKRELRR